MISSRRLDGFYERADGGGQTSRRQRARQRRPAPVSSAGNRWNPMIDAISTYVNGCELDAVSISNGRLRRHRDQLAGAARLRALIAAYGAPAVCAQLRVTLIDHSGKRVRIETSKGALTRAIDRHRADQPDRREAIRFHPALPAKVDAARGLPLGLPTR